MRTRSRMLPFATLAIGLTLGLASTALADITSSYENATGKLTVVITSPESFDNIVVKCKDGDLAANFTINDADFGAAEIITINGEKYVKFPRNAKGTDDETVIITGPTNRGNNGNVMARLGGVNKRSTVDESFLSIGPGAPGLSPAGLGLLLLGMLAVGGFSIARLRNGSATA